MTGTSTAKALWEGACKCVPSDTQVWTLENATGFLDNSSATTYLGGVPLICCNGTQFSPSTSSLVECPLQTFDTLTTAGAPTANMPLVCGGTIQCTPGCGGGVAIVDCPYIAFRNYNCKARCWIDNSLFSIINDPTNNYSPVPLPFPPRPLTATPCRLYLTAGSWLPLAVATSADPCPKINPTIFPSAGSFSTVKIEILKALSGIISCFVSCGNLCQTAITPGGAENPAAIPDTLVDTSILLYAFNKGGFCGNYFDSNGDPIRSAAQFVRDVLAGEDILFDCTSPVNTGACGCLCANESAVTINLCDYPCLASRLICTEKLVWTLNSYINCHRPRSCCGTCLPGTV